MAITGITFLFHNLYTLIIPIITWAIISVWLMLTEEKWLLDLYGEEYEAYKKKVNRLIPWKR